MKSNDIWGEKTLPLIYLHNNIIRVSQSFFEIKKISKLILFVLFKLKGV